MLLWGSKLPRCNWRKIQWKPKIYRKSIITSTSNEVGTPEKEITEDNQITEDGP
jgi:hypothetical protein